MSETLVFTDGASRGNPGASGWGSVIVHNDIVVELGGGVTEGTNNQMELTAVIEALAWLTDKELTAVSIYSDSTYTISGATAWIHGWKRRNWKTKDGQPVKNQQLWQQYDQLQQEVDFDIHFHKVKGHASIPGNERADDIATAFADGDSPDLYDGTRVDYEISLDSQPQYLQKSPLYFSFVAGDARRHDSWDDCKRHVSGKSAQYRKVRTVSERDELLAEWGVDLDDVQT
ncbi:MAG: ribonuclease H [Candidatus Paceibacterota bacterium]